MELWYFITQTSSMIEKSGVNYFFQVQVRYLNRNQLLELKGNT